MSGPGVGGRGHGPLSDELRQLFDLLAERSEPVLRRFAGDGVPDPEHPPMTCDWCPLCAAVALLRGERSELAVNSAELSARLVAALRVLLDGGATGGSTAGSPTGGGRRTGAHRAADPSSADPAGPAQRSGGAHRADDDDGARVQRIDLRPAGQPVEAPAESVQPAEQRPLHAVPSSQPQRPSPQPPASTARVQRISLHRKDSGE